MSISSSMYADYSNMIKNEWIAKLELAYASEDWDAVNALLNEMRKFYFSE